MCGEHNPQFSPNADLDQFSAWHGLSRWVKHPPSLLTHYPTRSWFEWEVRCFTPVYGCANVPLFLPSLLLESVSDTYHQQILVCGSIPWKLIIIKDILHSTENIFCGSQRSTESHFGKDLIAPCAKQWTFPSQWKLSGRCSGSKSAGLKRFIKNYPGYYSRTFWILFKKSERK